MFVKRTPAWSGWSTMAIGFMFSVLLRLVLRQPYFLDHLFSPSKPFSALESADLQVAVTTAVLFSVCISWYFCTMLFYRKDDHAYADQVDKFFKEMNTPIDPQTEGGSGRAREAQQYRVLGYQALIYGGFIYLLLLIPNRLSARAAIFCCGTLLVGAGAVLHFTGSRQRQREARELVSQVVV